MTTMIVPDNVDAVAFFESVSGAAEVSLPSGKTFCVWPKESLADLATVLEDPEFRNSLKHSIEHARADKFHELDLDSLD